MQQKSRSSTTIASSLPVVAMIAIAAAIFTLDTITSLEIAFAVLYVAVVLLAVRFLPPRGVLLVSLACVALTVLSALISLSAPLQSAGIINCAISIAAIAATTYLGSKNQEAGMALQDARTELAHVNRVATLGELTAAITHEVNQPIAGAVTNAEAALSWLDSQPPNVEEVRQALDGVVADGKRASEIIERIRGLMGRIPPTKERIDMNGIITDVVRLMRNEVQRHQILLQTFLASDLPAISGDRIQLQQVVLNLMLNAVEAISANGVGPRELVVRTERHNQDDVLVTVRDSGPGLDPKHVDRLFQAFYTTKPRGIGMGLSICRSIIEAHGGRIWADAAAPRGAVFHFSLPAHN